MTKHFKRPLQWGLLCMGITLMTGCQQSEVENSESNDLRMSLVARIGNLTEAPASRYAGDEPNHAEFAENDCIGVFMDEDEALKWTYGLSGWTAETLVYWPDKTEEHSFCAFYPYAEATSTEEVPMPDLKSQAGTMESLSACDFLVAATTQSYGTDGTVAFYGEGKSFSHVSSLLKLTIKGDGDLQTSTLDKISIAGTNIVAPSTYSFVDKAVTLSPDADSDLLETTPSHEMNGADATYYFIVNEKLDASATVTLTIEYTTAGKTYVASMENFAGNTFAGGMQQSYTITIKDSSLIISGSEIEPWGEGETLEDIIINGDEKA
ncbi:MAG: fimbrillin family protein [Bacteroidaceae bacterium]|nr:fimbrillin family protein [Bacteroidaceae bacterium]